MGAGGSWAPRGWQGWHWGWGSAATGDPPAGHGVVGDPWAAVGRVVLGWWGGGSQLLGTLTPSGTPTPVRGLGTPTPSRHPDCPLSTPTPVRASGTPNPPEHHKPRGGDGAPRAPLGSPNAPRHPHPSRAKGCPGAPRPRGCFRSSGAGGHRAGVPSPCPPAGGARPGPCWGALSGWRSPRRGGDPPPLPGSPPAAGPGEKARAGPGRAQPRGRGGRCPYPAGRRAAGRGQNWRRPAGPRAGTLRWLREGRDGPGRAEEPRGRGHRRQRASTLQARPAFRPAACSQSQERVDSSPLPIVFSACQSRWPRPTERRSSVGSRPRGSPPPPPRRLVNQSTNGDGLMLIPLARRAVNQRSDLRLGLRFRPSPRRSAPIGAAVTPSRVLLLDGAARQAESRIGLVGDKASHRLLDRAPASRVGIGQEPAEGRVRQGGARAAPEEEDGAVRGSEPPPPLRPVCAGPRRGRTRCSGGWWRGGRQHRWRRARKGRAAFPARPP